MAELRLQKGQKCAKMSENCVEIGQRIVEIGSKLIQSFENGRRRLKMV
jgi:hypothetical protein